jgi:hypothetical protein
MCWEIAGVNSVLGLLHRVDLGDVTDISEVHVASIFRVKVSKLVSCYSVVSKRNGERRVECGLALRLGQSKQRTEDVPFKGPGMHQNPIGNWRS